MGIVDIAYAREAIVMLSVALVALLLRWRWESAGLVGSSAAAGALHLGAASIAHHVGFQDSHVFVIGNITLVLMVGWVWFLYLGSAGLRLPSVSSRFIRLSCALVGTVGVVLATMAEFDGWRIVIAGLMAADFVLVVALAFPGVPGDDRR